MIWPPVPKVRIEVFGDSTTAGTFLVDGEQKFVWRNEIQHLQWIMEEHFGGWTVGVVNNGIGGTQAMQLWEGSGGYASPWESRMSQCEADIIVLNYGLNDAFYYEAPVEWTPSVSPDVFSDILTRIIVTARSAKKEVVVQTPNPTKWQPSPWSAIYAYVERIHAISRDMRVPLVDQFHFLQQVPDWKSMLAEDGVHPNPAMYALKAHRTASILVSLVRSRLDKNRERLTA